MVLTERGSGSQPPGSGFREGFVDASGFRIRYLGAGAGPPLVHLHGAGGLNLTRAHDLLSDRFRVLAFEMPGFGLSPENTRTQSLAELGATMAEAVTQVGIEAFNLWGTSFGGAAALWLAVQAPERIQSIVLESPGAIRPEGWSPAAASPEEMRKRLYAHPDRVAHPPAPAADVLAKTRALTSRLRTPNRDPELERRMRDLEVPALVLFGTGDRLIPPEMGHLYKQILPNCHLVFVYDAGHEIGAERPEAFVEVTADFLERHEAFIISRRETIILP
jgi:pimeloyl-ACP methyl ester carboxylesterase